MGRLEGKVALISGGARGQGAAEARMFALEGAKVVLGDVLDDEGKKVEAQIRELGGEATYVHLDVTKEPDWQDAVSTAVRTYGKRYEETHVPVEESLAISTALNMRPLMERVLSRRDILKA